MVSSMKKQASSLKTLSHTLLLVLSASTISASYALAGPTTTSDMDAATAAALNANYDDLSAAGSSAVSSSAVSAAEDSASDDSSADVYDLGRSVVSASGFSQDLREAPASMSIVTGEEIRAMPARDVGDMVATLPGIEVEKSKTGNSNVMIRGFSSDYTLFMVDGKRQNTSSAFVKNGFNPNFGYTPPSSMIDRIEIIRGPASTLYGSDAVGGVINVITKKHPEKLMGSISFETLIQEHDKFGNAAGTNGYVAFPVIQDLLSLQLRGRYYEKDHTELRDPNGDYLAHSANDFDMKNYGAKITLTPNKDHSISLDGEQSKMKAGTMSTSAAKIMVLNNYKKDQLTLNYDGKYDFGDVNSYLQYYSHSQDAVDYTFYDRSYIFETKAVTPFNFNNLGALNLTSGYQFWREEFRDDSQSALVGQELDHDLSSLYLEGEYFITDSWIATLGARYSHSDIFGGHLTPRGYLVFKATDNLTFKGGVSAGYKLPNVKQLNDGVISISSRNGAVTGMSYGNPDLDPETSINYELSVMYELPKVGSITLTGFRTDFDNKLGTDSYLNGDMMANGVRCDLTGASSSATCSLATNFGKTRSQGIELLFTSAKFYNTVLTGSYTYTSHKHRGGDSDGEYVNAIPKHSASLKLSWDKENFGFFVKGVGKFRTPYLQGNRNQAPLDFYKNYVLVDVGAHYNFTPQSRLNFTINNVLDFDAYDEYETVTSSSGTSYYNYYRDYIEGRSFYLNYTLDF